MFIDGENDRRADHVIETVDREAEIERIILRHRLDVAKLLYGKDGGYSLRKYKKIFKREMKENPDMYYIRGKTDTWRDSFPQDLYEEENKQEELKLVQDEIKIPPAMSEEQTWEWLRNRLQTQQTKELKADFESNQRLLELIDPEYERVEFSKKAAIDLFEQRISKIMKADEEAGIRLPEGEIDLEDMEVPHNRVLASSYGADSSDFEVEEGDPDGEAKLEKYHEDRREKLVAQCREIAAELDDSEEELEPITEEEL